MTSAVKYRNLETLSFRPRIFSALSVSPRFKVFSAAYEDIPGFHKSASLDEIAEHGYVLPPGRYVGAEKVEDDGILLVSKPKRGLTNELATQFYKSGLLDKELCRL